MKKRLHFLLSMVVLTLLSVGGAKAQSSIESELVHTASASWDANNGRANTVDSEEEYYNNEAGTGWAGVAFAEFNMNVPKNAMVSNATLEWVAINGNNNASRNNYVYCLNAGQSVDYEDIKNNKNAQLFSGAKTLVTNVTGTGTYNETTDVTDVVKAILESGQPNIIFQWTGNAGGATLAGKASENAPKLVIEYVPGAPELANPSFELSALDTPLAEEIIVKNEAPTIYGWTLEGVGTQYSNTEVRKADSETVSTSQFGTSNPSDGEYSLFYRNGWNGGGTAVTLTSDAIAELPAGDYLLSVDYKQRYSYDEDKQKNENTHVSLALKNGEEVVASEKSGAAGGDKGGNANTYFNDTEWSTLSVPFSIETALEGAQVVITLNAAGARRSDFYIDNVQLVNLPGIEVVLPALDKAIKAAQAEADKYIVGEGLFQYAESEIEPLAKAIAEAQAAYDAAESKDAVQAAIDALNAAVAEFAPVVNVPEEGKAYTFSLTTSEGTFQLNMDNGIKIEKEGTQIYFVAQDGGTYALSNGEEYINYEGGDTWTLNASADAYGWTIAAVEGGYTITGKNGFLGTNDSTGNPPGNSAGSSCYGDKKASNGNYIWTIERFQFKNTPLTQEMFKTWDGFDASANVVSDKPYWDAAELGTTVEPGATVYGSGNVTNTDYADITDADVLRIVGTPGLALRVLLNRQEDQSLVELNPNVGEEGYVDVDLTSYEYVHVNAIKLGWGSPAGAIDAFILNPTNDVYEGFLAENGCQLASGMDMGNLTEAQTVAIAPVINGVTSITYSGINFVGSVVPMPITIPEFTVGNVAVTENADGTISYSCEEVVVSVPMGNMTSNYVGSLTGVKADADATPVITLTIANAVQLTTVFAATAEEAEAALAAALVKSYSIEIAATENGTVTADVEEAEAGATVTLTVTPAENYELDALTVTYGEDNTAVEVVEAEDGTYTFTMPEADVTVTATFAEVPPVIAGTTYEGVLVENGQHAQAGDMGTATEAQTVTIADPVDGVTSITFSGINYVGTTVPMPITIPEFTIGNVNVVENADGTTSYYCEEVVVEVPMGNMTANYVGALQGLKVSEDSTPVIVLVLANAVKLTVAFAATADEAQTALGVAVGINAVKADAVKADGKYFEDGKVVIYRNGVKYGINGAAVK